MSNPVRIRIGASIEASVDTALKTTVSKFAQAEKAIQRQKRDTAKLAENDAKLHLRAQERYVKAAESLDRQRARGLFAQYKQQEAAAERAAKAELRSRQRTEESARREIEKTFRASVRTLEQETRARERAEARARDRFATRTSHRATRFLMPNAPIVPMVGGAVRSVVDSTGVDLSLGGNMQRALDFNSQMIALRNQARMSGKPMQGGGLDAIKGTADEFGFSRTQVAEAVGAFATKTGDINLGLDSIREIAKRAAATNSDLIEMANASADVANGLGDIPNKARAVVSTMDGFIVQGARGAVEIRDMASKMPKFAASAGRFEGDVSQNMLKLGALGQLARQSGGATSAAEAATSVARFADTFGTNARAKEFKAHGIDVFNKHNQIRDPLELIREALKATNGDQLEMGKLFSSSLGVKSVRGLTTAFNNAGGGAAGMKAVNDMFDGFMKDLSVSDEKMKQNLDERDADFRVKAQRFNNKLEDITSQMAGKMLPALEKLEGPALVVADTLSKLAQSAAEHPWGAVAGAIAAALGLAITRAGLESYLRAKIESLFSKTPMPVGGGAGGSPTGGSVVLGGLRNGGWKNSVGVGLAAGIVGDMAWREADSQNEQLKKESAGMGFGDLMWESLKSGRTPFEVVDQLQNKKARDEAKKRDVPAFSGLGTGDQEGKGGTGATIAKSLEAQNQQLQRELQQSRQVQQSMLEQLTRIASVSGPPVPGGADGDGRTTQ